MDDRYEDSQISQALVLAAHPDDAELAMGGTIAMLSAHAVKVTVACFTTSETTVEAVAGRRRAAHCAAQILGYEIRWIESGDYNHVEDLKEYRIVAIVDAVIDELQPDVVFSHWEGDSHGDHVRIARAAVAASRRWTGTLYAFGPSEYRTPCFGRVNPNTFVDISRYEKAKLAAIRQYAWQGQTVRSLECAAVRSIGRHVGSLVGCESAEGFLLLRQRGLAHSVLGWETDPA